MKFRGVISLRKLLPICATPNGKLDPRGVADVLEVDEDPLRGFGPQERFVVLRAQGTEDRLEHQVEFAGLGQLAATGRVRTVRNCRLTPVRRFEDRLAVLVEAHFDRLLFGILAAVFDGGSGRLAELLVAGRRPVELGGAGHEGPRHDRGTGGGAGRASP